MEHIELASQASSVDEIRMRNAIVIQRLQQEIQKGDTEPQLPPPRDTKDLDESWGRLEQEVQKSDINEQLRHDIIIILANLNYMYQLTRWGKK